MTKFWASIFALGLFINVTIGQVNILTGNPDNYLNEITTFFNTTGDNVSKKELKDFIESFTIFWNSANISSENKKLIADISLQMQNKKMQAFPHFRDYLNVVQMLVNTNQSDNTIKNWHNALNELLKQRTNKMFLDFLEFSRNFFVDSYLNKTPTTEWKTSSKKFEFVFDKEPKIIFSEPMKLVCYANEDSSVIYNTTGIYYPNQYLWVGNKGRINWQRAGIEPTKLFADFGKYKIDTKKREYTIDSVDLYYPEIFGNQVLRGRIEEKVLKNRGGDDALYPVFQSVESRTEIKNIFKDIDYEGGYTIKGNKLLGSGDEKNDAYLKIYREGKLFMKVASKSYIIRKDRISTDKGALTIYWGEDSIYHPSIPFRYIDEKRQITTTREKEGLSQAPFINTYHKIEMDFETMTWRMDEPKIEFNSFLGAGTVGTSYFTSEDYFTVAEYERLKGLDQEHPLIAFRNCAKQYGGGRYFDVKDLSKYLKIQIENARNEVVRFATEGFLIYDAANDRVFLREKLFNYLDAHAKRKDYDVIKFKSSTNARIQSNATLNLLNFDLDLEGVSLVFLSDVRNVTIFPREQKVKLKRNRDFHFSGIVRVGLFDFLGSDFSFEYDQFRINMPQIDSLSFRVESRTPDEFGKKPMIRVKSIIEDLSGDVLIDNPGNKSGVKPFEEYPIFNSKKYSYVYYDKNSIYKGQYPRDVFYYRIDPFQLDSMNTLTTDGIEFVGYLASAGIFPDIHQPLKVQEDYSLGFTYKTPENGLEAYKGKGTFTNIIDLSNQGLRGDGTLSYLTSKSVSKEFVFFPEKMISKNTLKFDVEEAKTPVDYPLVKGTNISQIWYPYQDLLTSETKETPIEIFKEKALLTGRMDLRPSGLSAKGKIDFNNATVTANKFTFKTRTIDSDTCDFMLKSYDLTELLLVTKNYKGHIDMDERKGEFIANAGKSVVEFPVNQYKCSMDKFDWYMDKDEIDLGTKEVKQFDYENVDIRKMVDVELSGSEFVSTHPQQDSLRFKSPRANFNLRDKIIRAYDVELIYVADAAIIPKDGVVTILKDAEMVPFENSRILANVTTKYHTINKAYIKVYGRYKYTAKGEYEYFDKNKKLQIIKFDDIGVDETYQTVGTGTIPEEQGFTLSPYFSFQGQVKLTASKPFLFFDGATQIKHACEKIQKSWLKFKSEINPNEVIIPIDSVPRNLEGEIVNIGFLQSLQFGVYTAFIYPKVQATDVEIISATGYLDYDEVSNQYRVSTKEKLKQFNSPGNYLSLDVNECNTFGEGKLSIGNNLGRVELNMYGNIRSIPKEDATKIKAVVELNFFYNSDALKIMYEAITSNTTLEPVNVNSELFRKYLYEVVGIELGDKAISDLNLHGQIRRMPDILENTITFVDVNFVYNSFTKSYISEGKLGIAILGKNQVYKYVNGTIEIEPKRAGDVLRVYIEVEPGKWFFFTHRNTQLKGLSSIQAFNEATISGKADSRQLKAKDGKGQYSYYIATPRDKENFLKRIQGEEVTE